MERIRIKYSENLPKDFFGLSSAVKKIIKINKTLSAETIEEIHKKIFKANHFGLDKEIVAIAMNIESYTSIVKISGLEPKYMDYPVIIESVEKPIIKFKAKIELLYPEKVKHINL